MFSYLKLYLLSLNLTRSWIYSGAIPFKHLKVSKAMDCILPRCKAKIEFTERTQVVPTPVLL